MSYYFLQSTEKPSIYNKPDPTKGYMILVNRSKCIYGAGCRRRRPSVTSYMEDGQYHYIGEHQPTHWHIIENAKWTNGVVDLP